MMLEWMIRAAIVGAIATIAALMFERAFRNVAFGTRHAWTFALLATTLLPLIPRLTSNTPVSDVVPAVTLPAIVVSGGAETSSALNTMMLAWLIMSAIVGLAYLISYVRLQRARRAWRPTRLVEEEVFLSDRFGPAIFGFLTPRIVVPEWVRTTSNEEQRLIVLHEREHIRVKDHLQLLLTMVATVAMPWNPFVWIQTRRLRFALEADCDQRVLAAIPDHERYATLLVDVGTRQMGLWLTPALAEHRNGLERRITMLANRMIRNRWKAAALMALGIGATVVACESRLPQEPQPMREAVRLTDGERTLEVSELRKAETTTEHLIAANYPPLLRDAGIGGTVRVRAKGIVNGKLVNPEIVGTSGHDALDAAGLRVARELESATDISTENLEMAIVFDPNRKVRMRVDELRPTMREGNAQNEQLLKQSYERVSVSGLYKEGASLPRKMSQEPSFTPYTDRPELENREEVARALMKSYPPALRDAGIGGTALIWVLIDETGKVVRTKIKESSGQVVIDEAAEAVGMQMRFKPARNGSDGPVPVWVALPIVMQAQ
jgi:TonB family protein